MISESFISNTGSSFIAGLLSGLVLFSIKLFFSKTRSASQPGGLSMVEIKTVQIEVVENHRTIYQNNYSRTDVDSSKDDGTSLIMISISAVLFQTYFFVRFMDEIIVTYQYMATTIISFLILTMIHQYKRGIVDGSDWKVFLIFSVLISTLSFYTLHLIRNPYVAEYSINHLEVLESVESFTDFLHEGGYRASWLSYQMLGMICLLLSFLPLTLSLIYYNAAIRLISAPSNRFLIWFTGKTYPFARPTFSIVLSSMLSILAFLLISGLAHKWLVL